MNEKYIWQAGTPVIVLGIEGTCPADNSIRNLWKTVMAGRLEESFTPGSSIILNNAPMPGAIPARGWQTSVVHRTHERGATMSYFSKERREQLIHDSWRNVFLVSAEKGTSPIRGCRGFFIVRDSMEVAKNIGFGKTSFCERLYELQDSDFPTLLGLVPEIVSNIDWFLGGYHGWHATKIDRSGKLIIPE